jgi:hypothetical protein
MDRIREPIDGGFIGLCFTTILLLIGGAFLLPLGFPKAGHDGPITCDGVTMGPGDECNITVNGVGALRSYEGLRAQQLAGRGWELPGLLIGGVMLLAGLLLLAYVVRELLGRR